MSANDESKEGLVISDLVVGYGKNQVIHGISLEVKQGSRVALLGANGAGKTTLLQTISGVMRPKSGTVTFEGDQLANQTASQIVKRGVIQVPEGRRVFPNLTVLENLRIAAYGHRDRLEAGLERVFAAYPILRERTQQPAGLLSGGQQQMLALGRAIIAQPKLLLLDEMSLGLAPILVKEFYAALPEVFSGDLTTLIVEQNAKMAISVADYVYVLRNGEISAQGTSQMFQEDDDLLHEGYLGVRTKGAKP
ncbi:ABC transporter ATP-binding protein [Ilumatobacter sp.]|uniref:ABC transporter ATP-binding protein n=1 Tax=Ilumatobacter sp. TaxID=1967498 RepID=UPI00375209B3